MHFKLNKMRLDVAIIGAGPVGSLLANLLKEKVPGLSFRLFDPHSPISLHSEQHPSLRTWALSPASIRTLEDAKVWENIPQIRVKSYDSMVVWDASSSGYIRFSADDIQPIFPEATGLGSIVENDVLLHALQSKIKESIIMSKVNNISKTDESNRDSFLTLSLDDGSKVHTRLVVGADGANSLVKSYLESRTYGLDYGQQAVTASVILSDSSSTAWQRFLPNGGPIAVLPSFDRYASIVWSCSVDQARKIKSLGSDEFCRMANRALHERPSLTDSNAFLSLRSFTFPVPEIKRIVSPMASFPLKFRFCDALAKSRFAIIGDAAHSVHPLAGQGLNIGISDCMELVKSILESQNNGIDFGLEGTMKVFESRCNINNLPLMLGIHSLQSIFYTSSGVLPYFRGFGLNAVDRIALVKQRFARLAAGSTIY